jgi:hypothetical protein
MDDVVSEFYPKFNKMNNLIHPKVEPRIFQRIHTEVAPIQIMGPAPECIQIMGPAPECIQIMAPAPECIQIMGPEHIQILEPTLIMALAPECTRIMAQEHIPKRLNSQQ